MTSAGGSTARPTASWWPWRGVRTPLHTIHAPPKRVLLATINRTPVRPEVLDVVIALATPEQAAITVISVARIFGTSLGLPHPGLQPTTKELAENRTVAQDAADALSARGFDVRVAISKSRNAPKMIAKWATAKRFHAVVVAAPEKAAWRRVLEGEIGHEIYQRCGVPVHAVPVGSEGRARTP